ncbi:MAG: trypsin-like peptidase domain-containing protein [Bacilli bacterium]
MQAKRNAIQRAVNKKAKRSEPAIRQKKKAPSGILDFVTIVDRYKHAVVNIEVEQEKTRSRTSLFPFGAPWELPESAPQALNIGSGFIFDRRGYILTNEHVIHDASRVSVQMLGREKPILAKVVGTNYEHDLAVLKIIMPRTIPVLQLGRSKDVRVGEWVLAVGNPLGLDHSVTVGIVSAKERPMQIGDRSYPHLLQTDAAINRGNSGGPLINMRGKVIGINTAVSQSSQGIGFAIAVNVVRDALKAMMGDAYQEARV